MPTSPKRNPWVFSTSEQTPKVRPPVVSPFMQRLRTPKHGRITRVGHVGHEIEMLANAVLGSAVLRMLVFGMIGYWIGEAVADGTEPLIIKLYGSVMFEATAPGMAAAFGALFGLSVRWFFGLLFTEAWAWLALLFNEGWALLIAFWAGLALLIALWTGLATAASALFGRLVQAFGALYF